MESSNKKVLTDANEAVSRGDNEGFLTYCTEDAKWTFVGDRILNGKEAVRAYMNETYIEPPQFNVEQIIAEADFVTAIGKISLKDKDGKKVHYSYCDVWKLRDSKLFELTAFVIEDN